MTIEEIRAARLAAQEEIRGVLRALAETTGFSVVGVSVDVTEIRFASDRQPKYELGEVQIKLEPI